MEIDQNFSWEDLVMHVKINTILKWLGSVGRMLDDIMPIQPLHTHIIGTIKRMSGERLWKRPRLTNGHIT